MSRAVVIGIVCVILGLISGLLGFGLEADVYIAAALVIAALTPSKMCSIETVITIKTPTNDTVATLQGESTVESLPV